VVSVCVVRGFVRGWLGPMLKCNLRYIRSWMHKCKLALKYQKKMITFSYAKSNHLSSAKLNHSWYLDSPRIRKSSCVRCSRSLERKRKNQISIIRKKSFIDFISRLGFYLEFKEAPLNSKNKAVLWYGCSYLKQHQLLIITKKQS